MSLPKRAEDPLQDLSDLLDWMCTQATRAHGASDELQEKIKAAASQASEDLHRRTSVRPRDVQHR